MSKQASSRLTKREHARAERQRQKLTWNLVLLGGAAAVVLVVVWYIAATSRPGALPGEIAVPDEGQAHVRAFNTDGTPTGARITYTTYPPASGTHYGDLVAPWGVYTAAQPLEPDLAAGTYDLEGIYLHSLEHGGVVILYQCAAAECATLEQKFTALYDKAAPPPGCPDAKIAVLPYDKTLPTPVVALAWAHQLNLSAFDEAALLRWYQRFVNRGPEQVQC